MVNASRDKDMSLTLITDGYVAFNMLNKLANSPINPPPLPKITASPPFYWPPSFWPT